MGGGKSHRSRDPSQFATNLADAAELRDANHKARRMASARVLMTGAQVRAPCLHRDVWWGAPQPHRPRQAAAARERGQSQPPRRGVRCTGEPVVWRHCHCRGTESRARLIWPLRTQVWASWFSRSRALGRMLLATARALWPFLCVSARPPGPTDRSCGAALVDSDARFVFAPGFQQVYILAVQRRKSLIRRGAWGCRGKLKECCNESNVRSSKFESCLWL